MTRILVMQMARMGDVLMTGPLLRGLRREHPSAEIALMVMDAFAATPLPSSLYDRLLPFPLEGVAGALAARAPDWTPALEQLRLFVHECSGTPFDTVVNLDHTETSAIVAWLMPAQKRVGPVMRTNRQRHVHGSWMSYLRAAVRSREFSAFHLVDLFSWTAGIARDAQGLEIDIAPADHEWAGRFASEHGLANTPVIAMMLGASTEAKRWPAERFAALADALDPSLGEVVIVGGQKERALSATMVSAAHRRVVDATGSATLRQLAALLQRCRLLVTNDTGPMHVATAVGLRVMNIASGPVSPYETGPYGAGHLVVVPDVPCFPCPLDADCRHFECRLRLSTEDAAAVARFALDIGPLPVLSGARLLRARRQGASGRIEFVPAGSPPTVTDRVRLAAAAVWDRTLGAPPRVGGDWDDAGGDLMPDRVDPDRMSAICSSLNELAREADAAATTVAGLPKASPSKRQAVAAAVHARLERLLALGETERAVHSIATYLRLEVDATSQMDLGAMARTQASAYSGAARRARMLAQGIMCP